MKGKPSVFLSWAILSESGAAPAWQSQASRFIKSRLCFLKAMGLVRCHRLNREIDNANEEQYNNDMLHPTEQLSRSEYLTHVEQLADETGEYLEYFAEATREHLINVVRTHNVEGAIAAAIQLLALKFKTTVAGWGPDAEFYAESSRLTRSPRKKKPKGCAVTRST